MANELHVSAADGDQLKVSIRSAGERDMSALTTRQELYDLIEVAELERPGEVPEQPPEPPVPGETPTEGAA